MHKAAIAAIDFAIDPQTDDGLYFLKAWAHGEFDVCRKEWPEAPSQCYVGADPMLEETQQLIEAQNQMSRQASMWQKLMKEGDFSPATDYHSRFWRAVIDISAVNHGSFEEAMLAAVESDEQRNKRR